jgi:type IV pilus assembly protein PilA
MFMLMALKRNQKGLTLIELLAVLVIVGIIAAIAIPAIGNTINNSKTKADTATDNLIIESVMRYLVDEEITGTVSAQNIKTTLVDKGYLNAVPKWQDTAKEKSTFTATLSGGKWSVTLNP